MKENTKEKSMNSGAGVIVFLIILIIIVILVYKFGFDGSNSALTSMTSAATTQTITSSALANNGVSSNCTYSIWFYVSDWDTNIDSSKIVFIQTTTTLPTSALSNDETVSGVITQLTGSSSSTTVGPMIYLTPVENNMVIYMPSTTTTSTSTQTGYNVNNIPLQRWVNLLLSVYGTTFDIYLDGKLVQTQVLPGPIMQPIGSSIIITPCTGFGGWTSKFQFIANATNPQGAWDIYQAGYGSSYFSSVGGQNEMTISFSQNGNTTASYTV